MGTRRLEPRGPWSTDAALALLAAHTIQHAETTVGRTHRRLLRLDGELVAVTLELHGAGGSQGWLEFRAPADRLDQAEPVVRRWFELDVDQAARKRRFAADPVLGPLVARRPGIRVTGHTDGFEALLAIVVGQQISLAAARTVTGRLVRHYGAPGPDGLWAFPRPEDLAGVEPEQLRADCGFMASRARTVLSVSRAVADGLDLSFGQPPGQLARTAAQLLALPGIGPWTVDFLRLRALGDPDSFPAGDLVLKKALGVTTDKAARQLAAAWAPERSFAALQLWTEAAYLA